MDISYLTLDRLEPLARPASSVAISVAKSKHRRKEMISVNSRLHRRGHQAKHVSNQALTQLAACRDVEHASFFNVLCTLLTFANPPKYGVTMPQLFN